MGFSKELNEFKEFAMRGNVVDMAIGVIIGGAFGKIVSSLIDNVITPLLLKPALDAANLSKLEELKLFGTVQYGMFISAVINFIIIAFVLFLIIKGINATKKKEEAAPAAPAAPPRNEVLLEEIRDLLKNK
ncbi:MAG: large conductance mechanosensitive channel protein MscL [Chitinophagales bacterium]|nr:large conductance mechanosensitive channel protein MscL [Chitinophagales bacterium]MCO5281142.1 large conductance mechanosensitive channel protein MscL [Chitinophagales bacterium]OJV30824.1 MAG: mechanosensitive ion channel protein MscL [Bacteroidetes bacterium 37-13]HRN93602.1 large conductance mechanosensitive channel protein MscL [Chitinophagales bacterium]HRP39158.1 large conductance mechanosensitive channel protein MscL [Chitinophagales bacterium]